MSVPEGTRSVVFPARTSDSYVELVPLKPLELSAFTLCMRVAIELSGDLETILFAYRTRDYDELNVWRELDGRWVNFLHLEPFDEPTHPFICPPLQRLSFYLSGEGVFFEIHSALFAVEAHLCFTWDSSSGAASFFMDGKRHAGKIYKQGHRVRSGGKVILGQDPDSYFGDFDVNQSFVGEIADVNMWDRVLPDSVIRDLFSGRRVSRGNVFDWDRTTLRPTGNVHIINREL